jgi:predicted nucleic acid-binding protein
MRYVLDSSVAVKWVLEEEHSDRARQLRDDARNGVHQLLAPDVFPVELGHALTRAERQGRINAPDGWSSWLAVMAHSPHLHASLPLMPRAFALSSKIRIGIYDCLYVALADREQCELVTTDERLVRVLHEQFPFVVSLLALP